MVYIVCQNCSVQFLAENHGLHILKRSVFAAIPEIDTLSVMPSEIVVGGTITITCEVSGQPRPDITWFLNEEELSDSMNNGNLRIVAPSGSPGTSLVEVTGATVELSGTYRCVATNLASSASMDTFVEVDEAPGTRETLKHSHTL